MSIIIKSFSRNVGDTSFIFGVSYFCSFFSLVFFAKFSYLIQYYFIYIGELLTKWVVPNQKSSYPEPRSQFHPILTELDGDSIFKN